MRSAHGMGLPLGSQLGFTATAAVLLGMLFAMTREERARPVDGLLHHPRLPALLTSHAQVVHLVIVAFVIGGFPADTIGGSFFLMWIPAAAVTAVHWSHLRAERSRPRSYAQTSADGADGEEISRPWWSRVSS